MGKQNFVNQFKNTRRLAGLQGRRPLGGHAKLQFPKSRAKTGRGAVKAPVNRPPWEKVSQKEPKD